MLKQAGRGLQAGYPLEPLLPTPPPPPLSLSPSLTFSLPITSSHNPQLSSPSPLALLFALHPARFLQHPIKTRAKKLSNHTFISPACRLPGSPPPPLPHHPRFSNPYLEISRQQLGFLPPVGVLGMWISGKRGYIGSEKSYLLLVFEGPRTVLENVHIQHFLAHTHTHTHTGLIQLSRDCVISC